MRLPEVVRYIVMLAIPILASVITLADTAGNVSAKEYCGNEIFKPICQPDEVVLMQTALYGRMRLGRCCTRDYGYIGCSANVLSYLDRNCSGRRGCDMKIPEHQIGYEQPCSRYLASYLESKYTCVQVESDKCKMCQTSTHATITTEKGYLASIVTEESEMNCGSARCPWHIELPVGQRVNVTLFDFGVASNKGVPDMCFRYALIKEDGEPNTTICSTNKRKQHVYLSKSNVVEIRIDISNLDQRGHFMLYYEAVGCPELDPPDNSWVKQEGEDFTYGCLNYNERWRMTCKGTAWVGHMRVCNAVGCPELEAPDNSWVKQEGEDFLYRCLNSNERWRMTCKGTAWAGHMRTCNAAKEYCANDIFKPICQPDEVVVMQTARYGRMRLGRCCTRDYGYIGCSVDILSYLDRNCSGRRGCNMQIPELQLGDEPPCPRGLASYLESKYTCVLVESDECKMCQTSTHATITSEKGYLASIVTEESEMSCGSARCPWRIELPVGQRVNLTLFDYGVASNKGVRDSRCFRYALIKEDGEPNTIICSTYKREQHVYKSKSNVIEIRIDISDLDQWGHFMLYYEAVGCPKLEAPDNSRVKQEGEDFIYECLNSNERWTITCKGTAWVGHMRTCNA